MKYIFITGGVVSSLGKGLAAAALGTLLELRGLRVVFQKFDPYLNVDPGTMNPFHPHQRSGLRKRYLKGAPGRLSREHCAGDSARHGRDQRPDSGAF